MILRRGRYLVKNEQEFEESVSHYMELTETPQWMLERVKTLPREYPSIVEFSVTEEHEEMLMTIWPLHEYRANLERRLKEIEGL